MPELKNIAGRALGAWGAHAQMAMVQEECGELISAINQQRRGRISMDAVAEEIADVEITLASLRLIVGEDLVEKKRLEKMNRLETTLLLHESSQETVDLAGRS